MTDRPDNPPNPGSEEARKQGCACPVIDNHYGAGVPHKGQRVFWTVEDCKLHGGKRDR